MNKLLDNVIVLYLKLFITSVIQLAVTSLLLRNLGVVDFGIYGVLASFVVLINIINITMITTTYRFIAFDLGKKNDANETFNISFVIHIFLAILLVLFSETIGIYFVDNQVKLPLNYDVDIKLVFRLSILATIFNVISIPFQGLITALENFRVRSIIEIIKSLLTLACVLSLVYFTEDLLVIYCIYVALISLITLLSFAFYCYYNHHNFVRWNFSRNLKKYKTMLSYTGWISLGAGSAISKDSGSQILMNSFFDPSVNSSLSIAGRINAFVSMFSNTITQAFIPRLTKLIGSGDKKSSLYLASISSKFTFFIVLITSIPLIINTEILINLWLDNPGDFTIIFCQLLIINLIIESLTSGIPAFVHANGNIRLYMIVGSTLSLLSIPLSYILFLYGFQPYIFMVFLIVSSVLITFFNLLILKHHLKFDIIEFLKLSFYPSLKVLFINIIIIIYITNLFEQDYFIIKTISSLIVVVTSILIFGINKSELKIIKSFLKFKK
mgnify:CR=1 FL=1